MKDYMMSLYTNFSGNRVKDTEAEKTAIQLRSRLNPRQRKMLLRLEDQFDAYCDRCAFDAFVDGFRLAAGLAVELKDGWFSYVDDEERRAMEAFEAEHDTI